MPGGLCRCRRGMVGRLPRHAPRSIKLRRTADARVLAAMARSHDEARKSRYGRQVAQPRRARLVRETRTLREEVEDFLYEEAALLDEWRLDEWAALFTEDARYVVPTADLPEGNPEKDLVYINDDIKRIRARVRRLNGRHAYREYPWSRTRRFISNIRVKETRDDHVTVTANALVYRFRSAAADPYVGSYLYRLKRVDQKLYDQLPPSGTRLGSSDLARSCEHHFLGPRVRQSRNSRPLRGGVAGAVKA